MDVTRETQATHVFGEMDQDSWHRVLDDFQDANVFQTPAFCAATAGPSKIEYFRLYRGSDIVSVSQIRIIRAPVFGSRIAYIRWGPLCHRKNAEEDTDALRQALRLLRQEYVVRRGFALSIKPQFAIGGERDYVPMFLDEGYTQPRSDGRERTVIIRLDRPLLELRRGLDQKWRNQLNRAEKGELELREGNDDRLFALFFEMYRQMLARKRIAEPGDIHAFMAMQRLLPNRHKMTVIVAFAEGQPCAGAVCSAIGKRGIYLFGATADAGMQNKASYMVQWRVMEWLKSSECLEYDLHGVNAQSNPGVYLFKRGLCGRNGKELEFVGDFYAYRSLHGRLLLEVAGAVRRQRDGLKRLVGKVKPLAGIPDGQSEGTKERWTR